MNNYISTPCSMLQKVNSFRANLSYSPLQLDRRLVAAAEFHTDDMVLNNNIFHNSSTASIPSFWGDRLAEFIPRWTYLSENVAENSFNEDEIFNIFINSSDHRDNLLDNRPTFFGSAYKNNKWTHVFASTDAIDIPFPINCSTEPHGFAWPQPALPGQNFTGALQSGQGLCLDADDGLSGSVIKPRTCYVGALSQSWTLFSKGAGFFIQSNIYTDDSNQNICMGISGASRLPFAKVEALVCKSDSVNQQFMRNDKGQFIVMDSGLCLEVIASGLVQNACNASNINQIIQTIAPVPGVIQPYNQKVVIASPDGLCLDATSSGFLGPLHATSCNTTLTLSQRWFLQQIGSAFKIQSASNSSQCIDVSEQSAMDGAKILVWPCHDGLNQLWLRGRNDTLINMNSGKCMSLGNNSPYDSGIVPIQHSCHKSTGDIFYLN